LGSGQKKYALSGSYSLMVGSAAPYYCWVSLPQPNLRWNKLKVPLIKGDLGG